MTLRTLRLCICAALLGGLSLLAQNANVVQAPIATVQTASGEDMIDGFKLSDADIDSVLSLLEMLTGKTIIRPSALPSVPYTLHIKRPLPRSEAIQALETVLSVNGIGVAPMGEKFLKVVALAQVRTEAPEMINGSTLELFPSGRIAAKLFQPDYLRIEDFTQQAQTLISPGVGGGIVLFPKANAALVTDTITNLQRLELLLKRLDQAAPSPKFYTLKFAKASELVQKLQGILQNPVLQAQLGATPTYSADDRTNQVILVADSAQHHFFDELIDRLDVKADPNTRTEVLYLKHAESKDVASLLNNIITGQTNAAQKSGSASQLARPDTAANAAPKATPAVAAGAGNLAASTTFSSIVTVIPDERTNAVVVNGTMDDLRLIKELVDKIDIVLPQVRIEVLIAEVTLSDEDDSGISALGLNVSGNKLIGISGSTAGASLSGPPSTSSSSTSSSYATVTGSHFNTLSLTGVVSLTTTSPKSRSRVLSMPAVVTTHNKKATIKVGQQMPVISGYQNTTTTSTVATGYYSNVQYKDIGIELNVTPLIGDDGTVQMDITKMEVSDKVKDTTIDGNTQPIIGTRDMTSFITAKSGDIIVMGGLQRNTDSRSSSSLGPIPFLSALFGSRTKTKERTDLVLFLRPIVIMNPEKDDADVLRRNSLAPNAEQTRDLFTGRAAEKEAEKSGKSAKPFHK
jgi:general secretion pathway protein D